MEFGRVNITPAAALDGTTGAAESKLQMGHAAPFVVNLMNQRIPSNAKNLKISQFDFPQGILTVEKGGLAGYPHAIWLGRTTRGYGVGKNIPASTLYDRSAVA